MERNLTIVNLYNEKGEGMGTKSFEVVPVLNETFAIGNENYVVTKTFRHGCGTICLQIELIKPLAMAA